MSSGADRPRNALGFLEREEQRVLEDLKRLLVSAAADLPLEEARAVARRHPELTLAASAALGVLLAPALASVARTALPLFLESLRSGAARSP